MEYTPCRSEEPLWSKGLQKKKKKKIKSKQEKLFIKSLEIKRVY